ncbi:MAG TPA: hypothetical protein DC042_11875 [Bacteroidales bacterium]|nr:hypothetical protein [Bacteroidales bacterium]
MKSILITPTNNKDLKFLSTLLSKLGFKTRILDSIEKEDDALLKNMIRERKGDYVSDDEIDAALNR